MKDSLGKPTIGLEIHAELLTKTKMFCDCLNDPNETHPNVNICPVCTGHPGALPVPNKKAIELVLKTGLALGGRVFPAGRSKFDRKNYFYPDLPKGYQISQYDEPLVLGGELLGVKITRIHLEEDAGSLIHADDGSLVDYNRSSAPLMELVTEPDIHSAEQAMAFTRELQLIFKYLGASEADMEKGLMRLEANISWNMGTKVEVKNINSFKALGAAIDYELARQKKAIEDGEKIVQETRGWDDKNLKTVSQRSKEGAHDYRYFPEPDIPPFDAAAFNLDVIKESIPELPAEKRVRFASEFGLNEIQTEILVNDAALSDYYEAAVSELKETGVENGAVLLFNFLTTDMLGFLNKMGLSLVTTKIKPVFLAHLVELATKGGVTTRVAKDLIGKIEERGLDPHLIVQEEGLGVLEDADLIEKTIQEVLSSNEKAVADYKAGKEPALKFLVGVAMGKLKGKADPLKLTEKIRDML